MKNHAKKSTKKTMRATKKQKPMRTKKANKVARNIETRAAARVGVEEVRTRSRRESAAPRHDPQKMENAIATLARNEAAIAYLKKNVSKRAIDVLNALSTPKTDEALALELDMKINAVRRILNLMQGQGVTNYYIAKNVNGWLSFAWYINTDKLPPFFEYVKSLESKKQTVSSECNDYFVCNECYDKSKLIFTFDAAFEEGFKCTMCGSNLKMVGRDEATSLIETAQRESRLAAESAKE
ncbi:MAG: hypothetical protein LVQ95_02685 [Candidatus Micrarchaeales archaeon]|nr:hypothetical protein [Candidatus Micrarchaeales archaeon]